MRSILDDIYWGTYSPFDRPTPSSPSSAHALDQIWADAEQRMGFAAADQIRDYYASLICQNSTDDFRAGFRLGAALMLEALDAQ